MIRIIKENKAVETTQEEIQDDKDDEIVVDEIDHRAFPSAHEFKEPCNPGRSGFIFWLIDVWCKVILLVYGHHIYVKLTYKTDFHELSDSTFEVFITHKLQYTRI